ncbi:UDP-N-acetylmuramate dehydrogenase [Carboxydochorda subterranea]|uniref:UDP-N-acetylenolpyruvoylglucosamine reductase n=1 Tax=Carboxydichorda subterranea TaxID=3109565 RepID=A0ABZ1BYN5_9FIRM|nr:UDP-N-acetylmuramate dehydrogenase [Limnochorda sp. L945t]WRP17826.1 UDP-N-acetylmuramate dehydrogenase [Limnochorda sp. L945t]
MPTSSEASLVQYLRERLRGTVLQHEPMADHTVFRIGGPADLFIQPQGREDLALALKACRQAGIPVTVIGRGSNLLVSDDGIEGAVIQVARGLSGVRFEGNRLIAEAGAPLPAVSWQAAMRALSGLEFAVMIPGSIGGAVVMNAGAHQQSIAPVVRQVTCLDPDGAPHTLSAAEMQFAYRSSILQERTDLVVAEVLLELETGRPAEAITAAMQAYLESRRRTQPLGEPGAGSIFKNPPGDFAGRLVEQAGLKGWRQGDVEISPIHANFIVNKGHARCIEVLEAVRMVRREVFRRFGVRLELEVKVIGRNVSTWVEEQPAAAPGRPVPPPAR